MLAKAAVDIDHDFALLRGTGSIPSTSYRLARPGAAVRRVDLDVLDVLCEVLGTAPGSSSSTRQANPGGSGVTMRYTIDDEWHGRFTLTDESEGAVGWTLLNERGERVGRDTLLPEIDWRASEALPPLTPPTGRDVVASWLMLSGARRTAGERAAGHAYLRVEEQVHATRESRMNAANTRLEVAELAGDMDAARAAEDELEEIQWEIIEGIAADYIAAEQSGDAKTAAESLHALRDFAAHGIGDCLDAVYSALGYDRAKQLGISGK